MMSDDNTNPAGSVEMIYQRIDLLGQALALETQRNGVHDPAAVEGILLNEERVACVFSFDLNTLPADRRLAAQGVATELMAHWRVFADATNPRRFRAVFALAARFNNIELIAWKDRACVVLRPVPPQAQQQPIPAPVMQPLPGGGSWN